MKKLKLSHEDPRHRLLQISSRSLWKERFTKDYAFYCPLCRSPGRLGLHPKPGTPKHFLQVGLTTAVAAWLVSPWWSWKGVVLFLPFWILFEVAYRLKVRADAICSYCGFDPYLYLVDVPKARAQVEAFWASKLGEPSEAFNNAQHLQQDSVKPENQTQDEFS